jgi:hypothetical protein
MADTCVRIVKDGSWAGLGRAGFEIFERMKETEILKTVMMTECPAQLPKDDKECPYAGAACEVHS